MYIILRTIEKNLLFRLFPLASIAAGYSIARVKRTGVKRNGTDSGNVSDNRFTVLRNNTMIRRLSYIVVVFTVHVRHDDRCTARGVEMTKDRVGR